MRDFNPNRAQLSSHPYRVYRHPYFTQNPLPNIYFPILLPSSSSAGEIMCAYIDCLLACVCAIADEVNEGRYPEPDFGADYCE
jgi:hypothetical protein